MDMRLGVVAVAVLAAAGGSQSLAARAPRPKPAAITGYAPLADLTLGAPVILAGTIDSVDRLNAKRAPDVKPGSQRYLLRLKVGTALKAPGAVPERVRFLWDVPSEARPDLLKQPVIAFLTQQTFQDYRLTRPDALIAGSPAAEVSVRAVITEARTPDLARRRVTGVQSATYVPGTVPGEAETQIFLKTASGDPVSLIVISRPGEAKRLSAAFGDVIDEAAGPIKPESLVWFYLACGLPRTLPEGAVGDMGPEEAAAARADYQFALTAVGACTLPRPQNEASSTPTPPQSG